MEFSRLPVRSADFEALCRRFHVVQLDLFGSAARGHDFDPDRSDLDILVRYQPGHAPSLAEFFALRDALQDRLQRRVDLVMDGSIRNPFVRAGIEQSKRLLYAA